MLAHGFHREMLAGLVLAGLAAVVTETMRAGGAMIQDHGRGARRARGRSVEAGPVGPPSWTLWPRLSSTRPLPAPMVTEKKFLRVGRIGEKFFFEEIPFAAYRINAR